MKSCMSWVFAYWLNSLWQVALVFVAAWLAARVARKAGPRVEHRVWVAALFLEAVLPFCSFQRVDLQMLLSRIWRSGSGVGGSVRVIAGDGRLHDAGMLHLPRILVTAIAMGCLCSLVYFAGRLAWGLWKTRVLLRDATPLSITHAVRQKLDAYAGWMGISPDAIRMATSSAVVGPVTAGLRRWTLLLPPRFLETTAAADLDAVLAHELAHLKRRDFAKNLLYEVLALPVAWHPLVWLTRAQVAGTREMTCDAMASETTMGRAHYAQSLLRLAAVVAGRECTHTLPTVGIFDADILERRIMNLKETHETRFVHRAGIALVCGVAALVTCSSALAFRVNPGEDQQAASTVKVPKKVMVSSGVMQRNVVEKVAPMYPEDAKKNKIQGTVILGATIGKTGDIEDLKVISGPEPLQQSSLDAVRQWKYKPYLLNGNPVEVETQINVVYSLSK